MIVTEHFEWSVRPVVFTLRLSGVDLKWSSNPSKLGRFITFISSSLAVALHLALYISLFLRIPVNLIASGYNGSDSPTVSVHVLFEYVTYALYTLTSHLLLLHMGRSRWSDLCQSIEQLEDPSPNPRLRRLSAFGLFSILILVSGTWALNLSYNLTNTDLNREYVLHDTATAFTQLYPLTCSLLFGLSCCAISERLRSLAAEIEQLSASNCPPSQIHGWKLRHLAVCDSVEQLNRCFGPALLLSVLFTCIGLTSVGFYLYQSTAYYRSALQVAACAAFLMTNFINILALTRAAGQVTNRALDLLKVLHRFQTINQTSTLQINGLVMQFWQLKPSITAVGLVRVNFALSVKVVGAALTYVVILCQFREAEK